MLKHGSLFTGIGGFDLAAHWMGWQNVFMVEKDEACRKVLQKNFPCTIKYNDIKEFNPTRYYGTIDIISGGFPCQPFSFAGKQKGKEDDRHLWPQMLRVIAAIKPTYVVGENVTGIIGMELDTVLTDLEKHGYTTETFIIPAASKNAWHRRDRVWILAYTNGKRCNNEQKKTGEHFFNQNQHTTAKKQTREQQQCRPCQSSTFFSYTSGSNGRMLRGQQTTKRKQQPKINEFSNSCKVLSNTNFFRSGKSFNNKQSTKPNTYGNTQSIINNYWETEPGVGRVVDGLPNRVDRLKQLGNAIVPQIAYEIFKAIENINK